MELDKYYRQKLAEGLEADYGDLLGDAGKLTSESLDKVLANFGPVRKLEILEEIFKAINANSDEMYKPKRRLIRADRKPEYTDLQRKHIQCLQETYLDILRNNKDPLMESCIGPSKLLAFKDAGLVGLKAQARQIVQQQNLSGMSKK
ncbi:MAG TPA: hypothetical protein VGU44_04300 [Gammaproteobacteria bacterium]|nr:hypothetical protein [Gammaproteobacteria bacterium]